MRITNRMLHRNVLLSLQKSLSQLSDLQVKMAAGKRILKPSDDVLGVAKAMRLKVGIVHINQFKENIDSLKSYLANSESVIGNISDILTDVRSIAVQGADSSMGEEEREALGQRINEYLEEIVDLGNSKFQNKYIYSGTTTFTQPFEADTDYSGTFTTGATLPEDIDLSPPARMINGSVVVTSLDGSITYTEGVDYTVDYENGTLTVLNTGSMSPSTQYTISYQTEISAVYYRGNDNVVEQQIDEGTTVEMNIPGDDLLMNGENVFNLLIELRDALYNNDSGTIGELIDRIEDAIDDVNLKRTAIGAIEARLDTVLNRVEGKELVEKDHLSKVEDIDMAQAIVEYQQMQLGYESAMKVGSKLMDITLLNFI